MHSERFLITEHVADAIQTAKKEKRKIIAVGTTTTRTLESAWENGRLKTGLQKTDLFIYPPYPYQVIDQMLTNFHLPESTLLMLVSAFAGRKFVMMAYQEAVRENLLSASQERAFNNLFHFTFTASHHKNSKKTR